MATKNLVDANMGRALLFAKHNVSRLDKHGDAGVWAGWTPAEGLVGELILDDLIRYKRPNTTRDGRDPNFAVLFFQNPQLVDIKEIEWGDPIVVESNVIERYSDVIKNGTAASYEETVSHTFSKTKTLLEAAKVGAELAVKAAVGAEYSGVKASVEVSAKISAEYSRQWGETTTQTDTIERKLSVPANTNLTYEVIRSVDKIQRKIKARSDFEYSCSFVSGPNMPPEDHPRLKLDWSSWAEFVSVAKGFAATDKALYHLYQDYPITPDDLVELEKPSSQEIEFIASYDNVTSQRITIV